MPNVADTLCLAAKAWSDACYLDEVQSPFREHLTMQDRHEVNKKAIEYAKQVAHSTRLNLHQNQGMPRMVLCKSVAKPLHDRRAVNSCVRELQLARVLRAKVSLQWCSGTGLPGRCAHPRSGATSLLRCSMTEHCLEQCTSSVHSSAGHYPGAT